MSKARDNATMSGKVVQTLNIRVDSRPTYTVSNTPTIMTEFNQIITPKYASSKILVVWEVGYEAGYNAVFNIYRNGSILSNGYNTEIGNVHYSGYAAAAYDVDVASTPNRTNITFFDTPATTAQLTYGLSFRSASASSQTIYINRTASSTGGTDYENQVSLGYVQEIAQ